MARRKAKIEIGNLVMVEWSDAAASAAWRPLSEPLEPSPCVTVGWLVADEPTYVTVAATICPTVPDDPTHEMHVGEIMTIPRGMVERMTRINV